MVTTRPSSPSCTVNSWTAPTSTGLPSTSSDSGTSVTRASATGGTVGVPAAGGGDGEPVGAGGESGWPPASPRPGKVPGDVSPGDGVTGDGLSGKLVWGVGGRPPGGAASTAPRISWLIRNVAVTRCSRVRRANVRVISADKV